MKDEGTAFWPSTPKEEQYVVDAMVHNMETGHETKVGRDGWRCESCALPSVAEVL